MIILLTDGEENLPPYIKDITKEVQEAGMRVLTVALGYVNQITFIKIFGYHFLTSIVM